MSNLFPYNAQSTTWAKAIDWLKCDPLIGGAPVRVWRKVTTADADMLRKDPRLRSIFAQLPDEIKEVVGAVAEGRSIAKPVAATPKVVKSERDIILDMIESVIKESDETGDLTAKLRGIELRAKMASLLSQKTPDDERTITINVVTGVPRE